MSSMRLGDYLRMKSSKKLESCSLIRRISSFNVTLLCRKSDSSVLCMEAGKDFVDILLSFLTLPIGSVLKLLSDNMGFESVGGIANIYQSLQSMDESFLYVNKEILTNPRRVNSLVDVDYVGVETPIQEHDFYKCSNHGCLRLVVDETGHICPACRFSMTHKLQLLDLGKTQDFGKQKPSSPKKEKTGYVKKNRTYIIGNDLKVMPLSSLKHVLMLADMNVDHLRDLECIETIVRPNQILLLLKGSFSSKTVLNDVFNKQTRLKDDQRTEGSVA